MCASQEKKPISVQIRKLSLKIWDKRRLKSKAGHVHWWLMSVNQKLNPGKNSILALESCVKLNACWMWFNGFLRAWYHLKSNLSTKLCAIVFAVQLQVVILYVDSVSLPQNTCVLYNFMVHSLQKWTRTFRALIRHIYVYFFWLLLFI